MPRCKKCKFEDNYLWVDEKGICKKCIRDSESDSTKLARKAITIGPSLVGTATGDKTKTDYYVYAWKIKETGEIFYIGKGRGRRAYTKHERAYDAEKIRKLYDTEVVILKDNLSEEEALQFEYDEMMRILNHTTHVLTNRITPLSADRGNGYNRAKSAPPYEFETSPVLFSCEIDEYYFGKKHRPFDEVDLNSLTRPHFINKVLYGEIFTIYGNDYEKYLEEVKDSLSKLGSKEVKTKYAKSVSCWIYSGDDYALSYDLDSKTALEKIGRIIPCYHLIDVWKLLKKESK